MPRSLTVIAGVALLVTLLPAASRADQNSTLVSQLGIGAAAETLDREGDLVAIAARHDGCKVIDVSNPGSPVLLHTIQPDLLPTYDIWDVDIHDGYLYLMNRPEAVDSALLNWVGVYVYDLFAAGPPPQVGYILWGGGAWHHLAGSVSAGTVVEFSGSTYAFLCSDITGDVEVFDVSVPGAPVYVASVYSPDLFASAWDVQVQSGRLFTAWGRGGFTIHDLGFIAAPALVVHQPYTGPPVVHGGVRSVAPTPDGTRLLTGEYTYAGTVHLWNVAGPLTHVASWQLGSGALLWTVRSSNEFAFVAHLEDGLQVLDLRSGEPITAIGSFDPNPGAPSGIWTGVSDVEIDGTRLYLSHEVDGLYVVDFGDAVNIVKAEWSRRKKRLTVWATSTGQPDVSLEVVSFGTMSWNRKRNRYELVASGLNANPGTVTVASDLTGTDTEAVTARN